MTRQHVLQAIAEHDSRGTEEFGALYGVDPSPGIRLSHDGRMYEVRALLAAAHRYATGRLATPEEVGHELAAAVAILRKRGFDVTGPVRPARAARTRATAGRTSAPGRTVGRRAPAPEAAPAVCPTCSMVLPATGICDDCG